MAKARVLVVEDKPAWQKLVSAQLVDAGHEVVGVANCERDAIRLFKELAPDIVTMDGMLLSGDLGRNVATAIRLLNKDVIIVMVSGDGEEFEGLGVMKTEPGQEELLAAIIEEQLKKRQTSEAHSA